MRCDGGPFGLVEDKTCCSVLNHLERFDFTQKSSQKSIVVIQSRNEHGLSRSCIACSVWKGLIFLMLCSANLHDRAVFAMWSLKLALKDYSKISS